MEVRSGHISVLLGPFLENGFSSTGKVFVDGTFGMGGHSRALVQKFPNVERIVAIDRDERVLNESREFWDDPRIKRIPGRISDLHDILEELTIKKVDGVIFDLGVSSIQLDSANRGFSFMNDGPLDMRMGIGSGGTAADLVNEVEENELSRIFRKFGEEMFAKRIARAIVEARKTHFLNSTLELADIVKQAIPKKMAATSRIHPATRVFQALRIAVNDELQELESGLSAAVSRLAPGGRLSVISFHSLEDRIVKQFFRLESQNCLCPPSFPQCVCKHSPRLNLVKRKPFVADSTEVARNPRSRSAKMRIAERLP